MVTATTHPTPCDGRGDAKGLRVAVVRSRFNEPVTARLLEGALEALRASGVADGDVSVLEVPGAVELAFAARLAVEKLGVDAVVCLGAVIRGETDHYDHVCRIAADTIARASPRAGRVRPLTCENYRRSPAAARATAIAAATPRLAAPRDGAHEAPLSGRAERGS
jgi:6,7-dimethyl-8-ribityllumazine synthase